MGCVSSPLLVENVDTADFYFYLACSWPPYSTHAQLAFGTYNPHADIITYISFDFEMLQSGLVQKKLGNQSFMLFVIGSQVQNNAIAMFIAGGIYLIIVLYNVAKEVGEIMEELAEERDRQEDARKRSGGAGSVYISGFTTKSTISRISLKSVRSSLGGWGWRRKGMKR